MEIKVLNTQWR